MPAVIGFWIGIGFLLLMDHVIPHMHAATNEVEGPKSSLSRTTMLVLAVTLHNIPEGMAVGVVFAGWMTGNSGISLGGALALSLGIAYSELSCKGQSYPCRFTQLAHRGTAHLEMACYRVWLSR